MTETGSLVISAMWIAQLREFAEEIGVRLQPSRRISHELTREEQDRDTRYTDASLPESRELSPRTWTDQLERKSTGFKRGSQCLRSSRRSPHCMCRAIQ